MNFAFRISLVVNLIEAAVSFPFTKEKPKAKKYVCLRLPKPSLLKSADPKPFFARIYKKSIEDLYLFTENQRFASPVRFNMTELI